MKYVQEFLLEFLEEDDETCQHLIKYLENHKIIENKCNLKCFLHLILNISNDHNRSFNFFSKLQIIFHLISDSIKKEFSNWEIFQIFKSNKRILLLLFEEKLLIPDKEIYNVIIHDEYKMNSYPEYFYVEFKNYFDKNLIKEINIFGNNDIDYQAYDEKRHNGNNDNYICHLIQNDSVEEFIAYVNQKNIALSSKVPYSLFETNPLLLNNEECPSLMEYAAFYGSIQIIQYLKYNKIDISMNICKYAIHSNNPELVHLIEENLDEYSNIMILNCYKESIKCHHNSISNYFKDKICQNVDYSDILIVDVSSYNFLNISDLIDNKLINTNQLVKLDINNGFNFVNCIIKFDWISIVDFLIKNTKEDKENHSYWILFCSLIMKVQFYILVIYLVF